MSTRTCHRTVLALPWLLNGSLGPGERRAVREHLIGCAACRAELARTRKAVALFGGGRHAAVADTTSGARAAVRRHRPTSGATLRRYAPWAAAVILLLTTVGVASWLGTEGGQTRAAAPAATRPMTPATIAPQSASAEVIYATDFEDGALTGFSTPATHLATAQPLPPVRARRSALYAHAAAVAPATIATVDFESGGLGELR